MDLFRIKKKDLSAIVNRVKPLIKKSSIPAYQQVKFEIEANTITTTATNDELAISFHNECQTMDDAASFGFVVYTKDIANAISGLDGELEIGYEGNSITITADTGKYSVPASSQEYFPEVVFNHGVTVNTVDMTILTNAINRASIATQKQDLRPAFESVMVEIKPDTYKVVGLSSPLMCIVHGANEEKCEEMNVLLPFGVVNTLPLLFVTGMCEMSINNNFVVIIGDNGTKCRVLRSNIKYPNYKVVEDREYAYKVNLDCTMLTEALKRMKAFGGDSSPAVSMSFSELGIDLEAEDIDFGRKGSEMFHFMSSNLDGKIEMKFPIESLLKALKPHGPASVTMEINNGKSQAAISSYDALSIVMPII